MPVLLIATLDTKGRELAFVRDRIEAAGLDTLVIDAGCLGSPAITPDIDRGTVFRHAGMTLDAVREANDRGAAVAAAARGAAALVVELAGSGQVEGVLGIGGSAGTTIATAAMRALPFGVPKVMVSTLASGQTRPYVGGSDIVMVPAVADIAGLNRITRAVLASAADALAGMVRGRRSNPPLLAGDRPIVTATMFGVTTPCVTRAAARLDTHGCEVLVFHATGVGGQAMESLIQAGQVAGVLDLTTTELADELAGGVLSAGPDRLKPAIRAGLPQVVSLGALDMVNFGPMDTVPERYRDRRLHVHNPSITLMRTTPAENAALGRYIATVLSNAHRRIALLIPRKGVSALDAPGMPFHDPEASAALFEPLVHGLSGHPFVDLLDLDLHINDPEFADQAADSLARLMALPEVAST